ncbi:MAG TPA: hypothetical protein DCS43_11695 [Verrucomicrobia bacterium]|nr:hypothetical protein [Verrucomicrobiota bacterium]
MSEYSRTASLQSDLPGSRIPWAVEFELTTRCNLNCRHCHINQPAADKRARESELSASEILDIAAEAINLGTLWCLLTGGEPLLRDDFEAIYIGLKKAGLLVSVFTNATCVQSAHVDLFRKYPPRDIEVSVYGTTPQTYEAVTRVPGSHARFLAGMARLREGGIPMRLKSVLMQSNVHEHAEIARFCRRHTKDYYRFDPHLNLRFDHDPVRNQDILAERLTADQMVAIEREDPERIEALCKGADTLIGEDFAGIQCDHRFHCGAGQDGFTIGADGTLRLCSSLWAEGTTYDVRHGSVADAWNRFIPQVQDQRSRCISFLETCHRCPIVNLCMWCPANAHLETGDMDAFVPGFCEQAHKRVEGVGHVRKCLHD